jgi:hypothetical protein
VDRLIDRHDEQLPDLGRRFWLDGYHWDYPDFENAETFVGHLARRGVIARDEMVGAALQGDHDAQSRRAPSRRTMQRHFLEAAGTTCVRFRQIERARYTTSLLKRGVSILDAVCLMTTSTAKTIWIGRVLSALAALTWGGLYAREHRLRSCIPIRR